MRPTIGIPHFINILIGCLLLNPSDSFVIRLGTLSTSIIHHKCTPLVASPKFNTALSDSQSIVSSNDNNNDETPRSKLRKITGFSLTALRATLRTATGFSFTALRATLRAATGISLSQTLTTFIATLTGILPAGVRYFLQPLLILYYAPMMMIRYYMVGPSRAYVDESRRGHERVVEGWRRAVEAAEKAQSGGYWPVHLNEDGSITASLPPDPDHVLDVTDGIEKSVELQQDLSQSKR
ncbi:hypothetical protein HJC23_001112 [Cyclotella cryptica]|uniref:Uncharacterized protein n=1 Tax=Cyclotella cryptica TaxID=29204 RepID=A0ABD3QK17_9STRA